MIDNEIRQSIYADLAGIREVAVALDVPVFRVKRWVERRSSTCCPAPVAVLSHGAVYSLAAWRSWFALWRVTRAQREPT